MPDADNAAHASPLRPLPRPDDPALRDVGLTDAAIALYGYLHGRRDDPPTMAEIRDWDRTSREGSGRGAQTNIDRRVRTLREHFDLPSTYVNGAHRYQLRGWRVEGRRAGISGRVRAEVLRGKRCAMCGRTPLEDGVKLAVDHKLPQSWGGTDEIENLQPLCEECNGGKQAWFSSMEPYAAEIRAASAHPEPQRRIGELLKAMHGEPAPLGLIEAVASQGNFQDDAVRRLRELRDLGWKIQNLRRRSATGDRRFVSAYRLIHAEPWGEGSLRDQLNEARARRRRTP